MKFDNSNSSGFYKGLKAQVNTYFSENNKSTYANLSIWIKGILLLVIYFGAYAAVFAFPENYLILITLCITMGLSGVMVVFNLVHDASHHALSNKKWVNNSVAHLGDLLGINTYIWDLRHNVQHHSFTNILGGDIIIENIPLIRMSPHQPHQWIHKYQLLYTPLMYAFYSLFWIFIIDFKLFFKKEICNLKNITHPKKEWIKLFFFKALYITYILVIPIIFLPLPCQYVLTGFIIMHIAGGLLLSIVAVLGHFVEGTSFPSPDEEGHIASNWAEHELEATIDFAPQSRLVHWITGGLNTHTAHHLFPRMSHCHYYEVTQLIRDYCLENGYPYRSETFMSALQSHQKYLRKLA